MRAVFLDKSTINENIDFSPIETSLTNISYFDSTPANKVVARSRYADIIITNKVVIDDEIMAQLPHLKQICVAATGTNNIDTEAARRRGISVNNVEGYSTSSVSQYVFAMLLEHMQKTSEYVANVRRGEWQKSHVFCHFTTPIHELSGKTLTLIGYGSIARSVETIARAFGMHVIIAERRDAHSIRPGRMPFEQALSVADVVSLHAPLTDKTQALIDQHSIAIMKKGAILINTARGGLIDNDAVIKALRSRKLDAVILDVLDTEPATDEHPLIAYQHPNLYITAHIAWGSQQAQQRLINAIADNIAAFIKRHVAT
ncbi:D-2-hydroxyacid dehydrogenase [Thalassotalea ponticola]|uniref:D-2-hydroxyacid dehydrogenase n=1 Tax=Thalassotalea ponticola TaxID=1523392 RepID=UPI0025B29736|nr:D-2-hydroxyacid dehydrogenase [Thalassotalea ponticola]MDN3652033.1 D-2-hydroxyacid dehydrogenase [Thalassotalea ponticola]